MEQPTTWKRRAERIDPGTRRFLGISEAWVLAFSVMMFVVHVAVNVIPPFQALAANYIEPIALSGLLTEAVAIASLLALGIFNVRNRVGTVILGAVMYYNGDTVLEYVKRPTTFTMYTTFWYAFIAVGIVALLLVILRFIALSILWERTHPPTMRRLASHLARELRRNGRAGLILLVVAGAATMLEVLSLTGATATQITITPRADPIEFRIWGYYDVASYNSTKGTQILQQMDRHHVTIQNAIFPIRDSNGSYESFSPTVHAGDAANAVGNLTWFKNNYPNIKFQYYAYGLGMGSCGNYEGSIYTGAMLKRFVDVCRGNNLTNVVGVYTDWEGPSDQGTKISNETLNGWHQALWTDAMAYARAYFPHWTFSCCYPDSTGWDGYDGDPDLQYYQRYNIFMPEWDDYGPMVYRSCDIEDIEPGSYGGSWSVYVQAKALVDGILRGNASRASMWLGCTGCGPYRNTTTVYEHGAPMAFGAGKGFDAFARDILILKHFGCTKVSIFHGILKFEGHTEYTGFFDQYGVADAFDKLNATVNGPGSTTPFTIWTDDWTPRRSIAEDAALNFEHLGYMWVGAVAIAAGLTMALLDFSLDHDVKVVDRKRAQP
ncbi:MAG: hypothetical protein Q6353_003935 [Candidatus Sigynarchaeum springense]